MSALFISQVLGLHLNLGQQLVVILTSIFASVGAAGIPEAGLVTMTLVFNSVGLPKKYIIYLKSLIKPADKYLFPGYSNEHHLLN